jgi:predicted nucleic acid-binding protein
VKLYADEPGADDARGWPQPIISALTATEVLAAFWGKVRSGELDATAAAILDRAFSADLAAGRFVVVDVSESVTLRSFDAVRRHQLRGADALQLATAVTLRDADPSITTVAAFDTQLRAAAAAERFALLPALL